MKNKLKAALTKAGVEETKINAIMEDMKGMTNQELEIEADKVIIETPGGDVPLTELISAYKKSSTNQEDEEKKKKELDAYNAEAKEKDKPTFENYEDYSGYKAMQDEKKEKYNALIKAGKTHANAVEELKEKKKENQDGAPKKLNMEDEYEGVKVSAMYDAYKKNQDEAAAEKKKKEDEDSANKKNADRKEALKSEGKTDEEAEEIMKSEDEAAEKERKEKEDEKALKSAEEDAKKAKTNAAEKDKHFKTLANARNKFPEVKTPTVLTKSQRIKAAKAQY